MFPFYLYIHFSFHPRWNWETTLVLAIRTQDKTWGIRLQKKGNQDRFGHNNVKRIVGGSILEMNGVERKRQQFAITRPVKLKKYIKIFYPI